MMTTLADAVGHPADGMVLPTRHSPSWELVIRRLEDFTDLHGELTRRGPKWLWNKLQRRTLPKKIRWGDLLRDWREAPSSEVREALTRVTPAADIIVWSWNARWLVDLNSPTVAAKRAKIEDAFRRGYIVCIQETHWLDGEARIWLLGLLCHDAYHSAACDQEGQEVVPGNGRTGRLGGVATLIPPGFTFNRERCSTLVPGRVIATEIVDAGGRHHNVVNCYLETGNAVNTWNEALAAMPEGTLGQADTIFVGDFNTDLMSYSEVEPQEDNNRPDLLEAGVVLAPTGPTCSVGTQHRTIDGAIVPGITCAQWEVRTQWTTLSDHAIIIASRSATEPDRPNLACSPHRFWALPQEARAELREDFEQIAQSFGVPRIEGPTSPLRTHRIPRPDDTDPDDGMHGLLEGNEEGTAQSERSSPAASTEKAEWNPLLAAWGHAFVHASFRGWWVKWRRRAPAQDSIHAELCEIASRNSGRENDTTEISPSLRQWLSSVGGPQDLTVRDAKKWLGVWRQIARANQEACLPRRHLGPTAARDPPNRATVTGRMIYGKRRSGRWIQMGDGTVLTQPAQVANALIATRRHIWFAKPRSDDEPPPILEAYMCGRSHTAPATPPICLSRLRGAVLAFSNSGVGEDGTPYEAYHLHPQLIACLIAQGFLVLDMKGEEVVAIQADPYDPRTDALSAILGLPIDLLIWIPKEHGNHLVTAQRPLQLPPCLRRIFGAAGMDTIGPALEPSLDPSQAARMGGSCQQNIRNAFQHLEKPNCSWTGNRVPHNRWACRMLFGACMEAVLEICLRCQNLAPDTIQRMAACFLLDQAKAFEYLSHSWLRHVIRAWKVPTWIAAFLIVMAAGRRLVGNPCPGRPGEPLLRGVGMGGPASLFTWALCFDPVAWIAKVAAACENLLYVDDLLAKTEGPGQTLLLYLAILAAIKQAGLKVEDHTCVTVSGPNYRRVAEILAVFPVTLTEDIQGGFTMTDGPVEVYLQILLHYEVCRNEDVVIIRERCRCKTKHALVPAREHQSWAAALAGTPLTAAVMAGTRFLGAHLCSPVRPHEVSLSNRFTETAISICATCTARKCVTLTTERTSAMKATRMSLANRSANWNTFCVSTVPYPASILPLSQQDASDLRRALGTLFPCRTWISQDMITDLGMVLQLRGTPRDPGLVADTASVMSLARGGLAGPEGGHGPCLQYARDVHEWAVATAAAPEDFLPVEHERRAARKLLLTYPDRGHFGRGPETSRLIYLALWSKRRRAGTTAYLLRRSRTRRWRPSEGHEWAALRHAPSWAIAWVTARMYCNGVPGTAQRRLRNADAQDRCWGCGCERPLKWRWLSRSDTPGAEQDAVGWCELCTGNATRAALPLARIESPHRPGSLGPPQADEPNHLPGAAVPRRGVFQRCPLCGDGEAGAEHLAIFCSAVANTWARLGMPGTDWWLGDDGEDQTLRVSFNHAVVWLCCALTNHPLDDAEAGCRLICRHLSSNQHLESFVGGPPPNAHVETDNDELAAWEWPGADTSFGPCDGCLPTVDLVETFYGRHPERRSPADSDQQQAALRLRIAVMPSQPIVTLRASCAPAAWPRSDRCTYGWPLTCSLADSNCRWSTLRCPSCGTYTLSAIATRPIEAGALVCSDAPPMVARHNDAPGLLISFDGGARTTGGGVELPDGEPPAAGAGAIVWSEADENGRRRCLLQMAISAPRLRSSMLAEAAGLAYGVLTLAHACGHPGPLSILGDNLPIIRAGACNSRLRSDPVWAEMEEAVMLLARRQWRPRWHAVRRHLNAAADVLATRGVLDALRRLSSEDPSFCEEILLWYDREEFQRRGWRPPTSVHQRPNTTLRLCNRPLLDP